MARSFRTFTAGGVSKSVTIISDVTPYFAFLAQGFPTAADRAVRHVGFVVQRAVKDAMRNRTPGYPELTGLQRRQSIDKVKLGGRRRNKRFPGDNSTGGRGLIGAFGFGSKRKPLTVTVGWLSQSAVKHGLRFQGGSSVPVTDKMRNYFAYLSRVTGGRIKPISKGKTSIENPARNVVEPTIRRIQSALPKIMEQRLLRNIGKITDDAYGEILKGYLAPQQSLRTARSFGLRLRGAA